MSAGRPNPTTAVSAPGKVLFTGGYLVLDRAYSGLVFGLSARISVIAQEIKTSPGVQLTEIVVESPQFLEAQWRYGYHLADEDGGILVTQLRVGSTFSANPFVETALTYALTYISRVSHQQPAHSIQSAHLTILADNDYYSQPQQQSSSSSTASSTAGGGSSSSSTVTTSTHHGRFARFPTTLRAANKTGLGSSAALVTSLTAALLTHYLDTSQFDLPSDRGQAILHNLAQAAHCAAQGKVGSGFDVAAAVYGSFKYRRFSPSILSCLPEAGTPGFGAALVRTVDATDGVIWDTETLREGVGLPDGVTLRMCDVTCGSQTPGMVKQVLSWRKDTGADADALWDELQARNEDLAAVLREGRVGGIRAATDAVRKLARKMGEASGVPIEPASQTELLDALVDGVEGVYGGVVPGAGGFDALALLVKDDEATIGRVKAFLERWSKEKGARVQLLDVRGQMEGVRREEIGVYEGWVRT